MPNWFYEINVYLALGYIFLSCNVISIIGHIIARRYFSSLDNRDVVTKVVWQTILFFSTMFITFWIATNWHDIGDLHTITNKEANLISSLYHDAAQTNISSRAILTRSIKNYLNNVIDVEYPALKSGKTVKNNDPIYRELVLSIYSYMPSDDIEDQLRYNRMLENIQTLSETRAARIGFTEGNMHGPLLYFLIVITVLGCFWTGCINTKRLLFSIFIIMSQNLILSSASWLILEMDKPFQGALNVSDTPFIHIQHEIDQYQNRLKLTDRV